MDDTSSKQIFFLSCWCIDAWNEVLPYKYNVRKTVDNYIANEVINTKYVVIHFTGLMSKKAYLTDPVTKDKFRVDGVIPSTELPGKPKLQQQFASHMLFGAGQLPPKVDLRPEMTAVEHQSSVGSW